MRELTMDEMDVVSGGELLGLGWTTYFISSGGSGNTFYEYQPGDEPLIEVTASRFEFPWWEMGFALDGFYGSITITDTDVYIGVGFSATPGLSFGTVDQEDLSDYLDVGPDSAQIRIPLIGSAEHFYYSMEYMASEFVRTHYPEEMLQ
jgi:hypothetical protein